MFVLDEADEMLSRGFKDQIYDVFKTLKDDIQVSFREKSILIYWFDNKSEKPRSESTSRPAASL